MSRIIKVVMAFLVIVGSMSANALEVHVFKRQPIDLTLEVGKQRIIELEDHAKMSIPRSLEGKVKIEPANGTVYVTALQVFDRTPARITLLTSKVQIRLTLQSIPATDVPTEDVKIVLFSKTGISSATPSQASGQSVPDFLRSAPINDVSLIRFSHQIYWLPERLRPQLPRGVFPVKIPSNLDLSALMTHCSLGIFEFNTIAGFKTNDGRYLTTLKVTNKTNQRRYLNLIHWNTQALKVSPAHMYVGPRYSASEVTTISVLTETPFVQAINQKPFFFPQHGANEGCI